jgi:hypothetical protein
MPQQTHIACTTSAANTRRTALRRCAACAWAALSGPTSWTPARATPSGPAKLAKATVKYVEISVVANKDCQRCSQFIAGNTPSQVGSCRIVEGEIAASAYCIAYSPKPRP